MKGILMAVLLFIAAGAHSQDTLRLLIPDSVHAVSINERPMSKERLVFLATVGTPEQKPFKFRMPKLKEYLPSYTLVFLSGAFDGARDGFMFRCDGCDPFLNGKQSWTRKYEDGDVRKGPAYFGSTTFLVWTTDGAHMANMFNHGFYAAALATAPGMQGATFWQKAWSGFKYAVIRQAGHTIIYNLAFKQRIP